LELIDDARLIELSREPVRELFPATRRDAVRKPLIMLLAFLPGLLVFWQPSLDEASSEQGLRALEVGAGPTMWDWLATASRDASSSSVSARPLAELLTALGLKVTVFPPECRLLLASYGAAVFLLLSLASLAKALAGGRFALLVVLLCCGHREFLALSGGLPPIALPLAFTVLSIREMWNHRYGSGSWFSWSLVGCGLSLAACWLSGGELASAAVAVLAVQCLLSGWDCHLTGSRTSFRRRLSQGLVQWSKNLFGLVFATALCVSMVAGWRGAFCGEFGFPELLGDWTGVNGLSSPNVQFGLAAQSLLQLSGPTFGFVMLGALRLARGDISSEQVAGASGRWWLLGWLGTALGYWWVTWPSHGGEFIPVASSPAMLLLPLLVLAAWGLEGILLREFGLGSVLTSVVVTVAVAAAPQWRSSLSSIVGVPAPAFGALLVAVTLGVVWCLRRVFESEFRRRVALMVCIVALILFDIVCGVRSRPALSDDERELLAFRRQLADASVPQSCWLLTEGAAPAHLRFLVRGLWPDVPVHETTAEELVTVEPWQTTTADDDSTDRPRERGSAFAVVVTWGNSRLPSEEFRRRGQMLTQATSPHFLRGRPLKAFHWALRPTPSKSR
jgi:hypothetical protein